jgi:hypothetical protein
MNRRQIVCHGVARVALCARERVHPKLGVRNGRGIAVLGKASSLLTRLEAIMTRMGIIGLVLILAGILMLAIPAISYTDRDQVADIGPIEVEVEDRETIALPPVLGGAVLALGVVLLVTGRRPSRA